MRFISVAINYCGRRPLQGASAALLFILALSTLSCTPAVTIVERPIDFSTFRDGPIPAEAAKWLRQGPQTRITSAISAAAARITGSGRRDRLFKANQYIHTHFLYDNWYKDRVFLRTADQLFAQKVLGGCSDYALAKTALFRALHIPARMVLTSKVDWMLSYQKNNLRMPTGHVFIEVYLEDRWYLVDSVYRLMFSSYDPENNSFPRGEYVCLRGKDFWDFGIHNIEDLYTVFRQKAYEFEKRWYIDPKYPEIVLDRKEMEVIIK